MQVPEWSVPSLLSAPSSMLGNGDVFPPSPLTDLYRSSLLELGRSAAQVGEDGQDTAVVVGRWQQLEFREYVGDVGFDRLRGEEEPIADRLVRASLGHQCENLTLAFGQVI